MTPSEVKATPSSSDDPPSIELPIHKSAVGLDVIDIRRLYDQTDKFTYNPGFTSAASCSSKITYIDGDKGELLYHDYVIDDLVSKCDFMEVCYLLLKGGLPNAEQKEKSSHVVMDHTVVYEQIQFFLCGFHRDAHPMTVLTGPVGVMSAFCPDATDINDLREHEIPQTRLTAKLSTLAAMTYKYSISQPLTYPQNSLSYTGNFMRVMLTTPCEDYRVNPMPEKTLGHIFILYVDHKQNISTLAVRLAGSSGTNLITAIAASIACPWGPAHGGVNEAALNTLEEIGTADKVPEFVKQVRDKNSGVCLMGFDHRARKNYDPRARLMHETYREVLNGLGSYNDLSSKLTMKLEKIALGDEYLISRKSYPNVGLYSGIAQCALGISTLISTCVLALVRSVGWVSQWEEMTTDPEYKTGRPRQLFNDAATREMPSIDKCQVKLFVLQKPCLGNRWGFLLYVA